LAPHSKTLPRRFLPLPGDYAGSKQSGGRARGNTSRKEFDEMKKLILLLMMMAAAPAFGQLGYVPSMKTLSCYSVSVGGWIPVAATSGGTALGYSPETVGAVGKSGTSYYPLACDANGNLSSGAILGITIPALTTGYLYYMQAH
jgi:hypothetical protein